MVDDGPTPPVKRARRVRAAEGRALEQTPPIVTGWLPAWLGWIATLVACGFLLLVFADTAKLEWFAGRVPRPVRFFSQVACLFPAADRIAIEYRAEGWLCRDKRWVEIDVRPFFPIDAGEKENRFHRTMHFYRAERKTMQALEAFVIEHENRAALEASSRGDSKAPPRVGGVRFSSLRVPLGEFGAPVERYAYKSISDYADVEKHDFYWTKRSKRRENCLADDPSYNDRDVVEDAPSSSAKPRSSGPQPEDEP